MDKSALSKLLPVAIAFVIISFIGCRSRQDDQCSINYKKAKDFLYKYHINQKRSFLVRALAEIERSGCPETALGAVELKISLLSLLKKYKEAYQYIDSLGPGSFKLEYKKGMSYNLFRALEYESKFDTANRNLFLNRSVITIQSYIDEQDTSESKLNEEAYYDLFLIKSKLENLENLNNDIEKLKKRYPNKLTFWENVKGSLEGFGTSPYALPDSDEVTSQ